MDEFYTLTFFGYADLGAYPTEDLQAFVCPEHYDTVDDARLVAEYWMRYGFFRSVRCDRYVEPFTGAAQDRFRMEHGVFYALELDGGVVWRNPDGTVTQSGMLGKIVRRREQEDSERAHADT